METVLQDILNAKHYLFVTADFFERFNARINFRKGRWVDTISYLSTMGRLLSSVLRQNVKLLVYPLFVMHDQVSFLL